MQFCDLKRQYAHLKEKIDERVSAVLAHAWYVGGPEVKELEDECVEYTGSKYAIATSSGTDSLVVALMALGVGEGDYVVTPPFTFIATAEAVALVGAKPIFCDIEDETYNIDPACLDKVLEENSDKNIKGIISVDLYGHPADYDGIQAVIDKYNKDLFLICDSAQSFGATYKGKSVLSLGTVASTSFFPAKPFGCAGDGGMVFTNYDDLNEKMLWIRNHGQNARYCHKIIGLNARLDAMQAAVLLAKFEAFKDEEIDKRNWVAETYTELLQEVKEAGEIVFPVTKEDCTHVWAQYSLMVKDRDGLAKHLGDKGIPSAIHYPIPLHMQEAFKDLGYKEGDFPVSEAVSRKIISLPMCAYKTKEELTTVANAVKEFYKA